MNGLFVCLLVMINGYVCNAEHDFTDHAYLSERIHVLERELINLRAYIYGPYPVYLKNKKLI